MLFFIVSIKKRFGAPDNHFSVAFGLKVGRREIAGKIVELLLVTFNANASVQSEPSLSSSNFNHKLGNN